ncbi:MAG TPA: PP2C family protein-serine/threonine phosphatase [Acidobacteriaceae bacterium]|nr:PP2C family protein-serine/threonine phosphatase [Acidobacteriaceae bacterium]
MVRSRFVRGCLLLVCLAAVAPAYARAVPLPPAIDPHHVDGSAIGAPIDLSASWLLQQGDDPRYADPAFDDSKWIVVQPGKPLSSYGLKNVNRVWYRTHVQIPPNEKSLSLLVRSFGGSFQIFVNGIEVGSSGPHPQGGYAGAYVDKRFAVPNTAIASGNVTVAVRAEIGRYSEGGTRAGKFIWDSAFLLGPAPALSDLTALHSFRIYTPSVINIGMELLVPLIALALALTLPREREYIALVIAFAASGAVDAINLWQLVTNRPPGDVSLVGLGCLGAVGAVALLEFVRLVLDLRRSRWWAGYEYLVAFLLVVFLPWIEHAYALGAVGVTSSFILLASVILQVLILPFSAGLPLLALWVWWKRRNPDALLLFVPFLLQTAVNYWQFGIFLLNRFHLSDQASLPPVPASTFTVQWTDVTNILFSVAILLFLVLRTVRIARSRAAMATDLHAVHSVQEILLARASHATPGFRVEHVYHPALEVGGDFFLVSPGPDGSLTAIVGDVSGKGLVAAMRVSMILGVLRREEHREPDTILCNLNEALLMQGEMGFTTACCVRLQSDGRFTIANAGHINPYIDGKEIPTPSALPLGLVGEQQYEQISGFLPEGKTLVLMSDGVVEARSAAGELYGFDRLPQLTLLTAQDIADVARRFGQEDDITVLTVACGA